jgi:uncharacterized protein (DUF362 family)
LSEVCIIKSDYDHCYENLDKALYRIDGVLKKSKVVIKINLCDARPPETGAITHPVFLDAVLRYLRERFGEDLDINVVESDSGRVLADLYIKWFGLLPVIEKWGAKWCNLIKEKTVKKKIMGRFFDEIEIPKILENSYFITLAKLKTNILTKITCALKNQHGCLPVLRKDRFHPHIDDVIVDENLAMKPDFCIVDGIIGMGGSQGPAFGIPIRSNVIVLGGDPVAVDSVCARIMGFNPYFIGHIRKAAKSGVGSMKFSCVGEEIENVKKDFMWSKVESLMFKLANYLKERNSKSKQ